MRQYKGIRWFSFTAQILLLALFAAIFYVVCVNMLEDGILQSQGGNDFASAVGTVAAAFFNIMAGVGGMIAAPAAGVLAICFGIRASGSRVKAIRVLARLFCILAAVAIVALIVIVVSLIQS